MCGITGMIDPRLGREDGATLLGRMMDSIRHRGPDCSSTWIDMPVLLGHNRLSIIDLSDLANQPMEYDGLVIVHNGEVYNYLEIRAELVKKGYRFKSESDTEVILAAYKEWGGDCVKRFVGMWAFAIWDTERKELFCSRDRFGIKPFYYVHSGERFCFGSEYKPLKLSPLFDSEFNLRHIHRGLLVGATAYRDDTYYECLRALPERSNLLFKNGNVSVTSYWDIDGTQKCRGTFEEKTDRFLELFRDSIQLNMRSDVAVGGLLSGGMDSASIASVVGTDLSQVSFKTLTIYYDAWNQIDERPWAEYVVSTFPNMEPIYCEPREDEVAESYDTVVTALDTPLPSSVPLSSYFVMKTAAENNMKVILDGQGSDEYLAGYDVAFDRHIADHLRRLRFLRALNVLSSVRKERSASLKWSLRLALKSLLPTFVGEQTLWLGHCQPTLSMFLGKGVPFSLERIQGSRMDEYLYHLIFSTRLPRSLHIGDRMSMASSVECRFPFLDHRLVEFVFSLDDEDKIREGQTKYILRKALKGIVPEAILKRKDKQPFFPGNEVAQWLRGPLRYLTELPLNLDGLGFINNREARHILREFKDGNESRARLVWLLVGLNYWLSRQ